MDKVTQSNAASAEEGAASSEELHAQSELIKEAVTELVQLIEGVRPAESKAVASRSSGSQPKAAKQKTPTAGPAVKNRSTVAKVRKSDFQNF
jgi:methyl-accepting chemotaxis protein